MLSKKTKVKRSCRERLGSLFLAAATILASWCAGRVGNAAEPFMLTSSAFKDGTPLAKKNAGDNKSNPNCVGENVSPPLSWSNPPAGTKSFALTMVDPEGRGGTERQWPQVTVVRSSLPWPCSAGRRGGAPRSRCSGSPWRRPSPAPTPFSPSWCRRWARCGPPGRGSRRRSGRSSPTSP